MMHVIAVGWFPLCANEFMQGIGQDEFQRAAARVLQPNYTKIVERYQLKQNENGDCKLPLQPLQLYLHCSALFSLFLAAHQQVLDADRDLSNSFLSIRGDLQLLPKDKT